MENKALPHDYFEATTRVYCRFIMIRAQTRLLPTYGSPSVSPADRSIHGAISNIVHLLYKRILCGLQHHDAYPGAHTKQCTRHVRPARDTHWQGYCSLSWFELRVYSFHLDLRRVELLLSLSKMSLSLSSAYVSCGGCRSQCMHCALCQKRNHGCRRDSGKWSHA
jgi:hypothetical protein